MKIFAAEEKSTRTNNAARQIMDAETVARVKKTARLREQRREKEEADRAEAVANPPPPTAKRVRKKAAS